MFGRSRHDRLFARFVANGDVHALGEVFDATAPELGRIAAHLVGSREQARDLVQSAFLIAIEKRAEFAAERRVLPWLCGIVANLARNERRRSQREPAVAPRAPGEDPGAAAEAAEFRAAFAQAKDAVPAVYRPVLDLHLEQGLNAAQIGAALGRPAGTVRTQIVRALEVLRRQLPRGFVAGFAVVTLDAPALRAMRALVVRRGVEAVPPTAAAVSGGLVLAVMGAGAVQKKIAVVGVAVLIAVGFWLVAASAGAGDEGHGVLRDEPAFAVSVPPGGARTSGEAPAPASSRETAPVRAAAPPVAGASSGSLEVFARWRSDGAEAHEQAITVIAADGVGELGGRSAVTDAGGRAVFAALPPGAVLVQASTGVRGEAVVVAGEQTTVTLTLDGVAVNGLVVDHRGEPVAGADVWVSSEVVYTRVRTGDQPFKGQHGQPTLRTDAQGRFATRMTARQCIAAFRNGHGPSLTQYPLVGKGRSPRGPIEVVLPLLPAGGTLAVVVRGKDAAALAGALVLAGHEVPHLTSGEGPQRATTPALRAFTDANGAATVAPLPTGRMPVQVRAAGHGPWQGEVDIVAGMTTPLDVALVDGGIVMGVVIDGTGKPLAGALVHRGKPSAFLSSLAMSDANGAYRLEHLPPGELTLAAFHEDWGTVTTTLAVSAGKTVRWDARLPPRAAITGRVLEADGQPAGGCYVIAFAERGRSVTTSADAAGRFTLSPLDPDQQYSVTAEVRLRAGGIARPRREAVPAGTDVELRVNGDEVPTARLRGRVLQPDGAPAVGCEVNAATVGESIGSRHPIAEDGTFELGPFHSRRVHLSVHRVGSYRAAIGDFGVHEMRNGATTDVGDLVLSATGGVRVRLAGAAAERAAASLFRDGRHVEQRRIDGAGEVVWDELPPGQYAVCVTRGGPSSLCGFTEVEVHAGRRADATLALAPATVRDVGLGRRPRPPAEAKAPGTVMMGGPGFVLRATDVGGRTVMMMSTMPEPDGSATRVVLPDSAVTLSALSDDGRRGSVPTAAAPGEPLVIPLAGK